MILFDYISKYKRQATHSHSEISLYKANKQKDRAEQLKDRLIQIDKKILMLSKELIQVQIVRIKYSLSNSKNWLHILQKKVYNVSIQESIDWHAKELRDARRERSIVQSEYDSFTGQTWSNRIKKWTLIFISSILMLFIISIFIMGLIAFIYSLPILIAVICLYLMLNRKSYF